MTEATVALTLGTPDNAAKSYAWHLTRDQLQQVAAYLDVLLGAPELTIDHTAAEVAAIRVREEDGGVALVCDCCGDAAGNAWFDTSNAVGPIGADKEQGLRDIARDTLEWADIAGRDFCAACLDQGCFDRGEHIVDERHRLAPVPPAEHYFCARQWLRGAGHEMADGNLEAAALRVAIAQVHATLAAAPDFTEDDLSQ